MPWPPVVAPGGAGINPGMINGAAYGGLSHLTETGKYGAALLQDADGDGVYTFSTDQIPGGSYEFKVALDEAWDTSFPGANVPFTSADGDVVTFTYDSSTNDVSVTVEPPSPPGPASVTIAGSLQDELGCPGDWQPECANSYLTYDFDDDVWQQHFFHHENCRTSQNPALLERQLSRKRDLRFYGGDVYLR